MSSKPFSRIVIIFNPNSTGPSQSMAKDLAAKLADVGLTTELIGTEHAGHALQLAQNAASRYDRPLIVSSSGDGGYHEVINGVMRAAADGHPAVAAVLPAGNANDHRRTVAQKPLHEGIIAGQTTSIDLLKVTIEPRNKPKTTSYAHSYMGLGLTPVIAAELNRHNLNAFRELLIVVKTFAKLQPVTIETEGRTVALDSLILSNINQMAKTLTVSKGGHPTDGKFEVTTFPAGSKLALMSRLTKAALGGLRANRRLSHYEFAVTKATPIQLDGEVTQLAADTSVIVTSAPGALETIL